MQLPTDYVEQLKREYPCRDGDNGWIAVRTLIPRALSAGTTWERILAGTKAYKAHCDKKGLTGTELVKQARTFYGPGQYFEEWADMQPIQTPQQRAQEARWAGLQARREAIGFRGPTVHDSPDTYETALRQAERERLESTGSRHSPVARDIPNVVTMLLAKKAV
jgi:hypothetical protein